MEAMKRVMYIVAVELTLGLFALAAGAQTQPSSNAQNRSSSGSSLGDYARQLRKDSGQSKAKPKVFDNDNLPKDDKLSIVGEKKPEATPESKTEEPQAGEKPAEARTPGAGESKPESGTAAEDMKQKQALWKQWQDKIAAQKSQIDLMQRELDVLQREYQIRAAAFYADAGNRLRNQGAWDKQDSDYKQQIADKTKGVADAKDKLDEMSEEARKAGVPSSMLE
jgi:hypothetical protein